MKRGQSVRATGTAASAANGGFPSLGRKEAIGRKVGHRSRDRNRRGTEPLLVQPIADPIGNVPCLICGHLVDVKRMHPHMVRFHGAALRSKAPTLREW